ncbi:unnamed protein product [Bemisia tabaci]|uniref:GP-PDE domain-containing protein n=1 Tax=Bemisia tabaci TaxID=7038 RepID=A0A9P0FYC0_BEMTA|nr:unnamed protein product [Bemisia tabaci]
MYIFVLGVYVFTSILFFKYPTLIREKKKLKFQCKHISHRGGAGESLENTLTAFRHGLDEGTQMLELDCQLTKDGQVVVLHDSNLLRLTGVDKNVSDLDYSDLPLLKTDLPIEFDPGNFCSKPDCPDRKIPLLSQVFQEFPKTPINIDIKQNNDILISKVNELIIQHCREDLTVWGNLRDEVVKKCYSLNKNINVFFSLRQVIYLILLFYSGLLPFVPLKETHLEIFLPSIYLRRIRLDGGGQLSFSPFILHATNILLMKRALFKHLSKRGIQTYIWVLNDETDFQQAFQLGATGVMTDYPSKLRAFLENCENEKIKC